MKNQVSELHNTELHKFLSAVYRGLAQQGIKTGAVPAEDLKVFEGVAEQLKVDSKCYALRVAKASLLLVRRIEGGVDCIWREAGIIWNHPHKSWTAGEVVARCARLAA